MFAGCFAGIKRFKDLNVKKVFIVTDSFLYNNGYTKPITNKLDEMEITHKTFFDVAPDPSLACAKAGAKEIREFNPDCIIAIGGGSAMDAGKIIWVMYEHPELDFLDMAMRFMDIRKRIYKFPKMGEKAYFIAVPTSAGTGSEVTPFAVITDEQTGVKYPLADYELMPKMAIVDSDMMMDAPKGLTSASGIDAVTHALEAYVSMMATDFTDGLALKALKVIFEFLPRAYNDGKNDFEAREKMAHAATMAGMAFANAFLGVCHSMAHKLGAFFHLPHGIANALMINEVIRFNSNETPEKMGTFPQYSYPHTLERYAEIADYLNKHPMFKDAERGDICEEGFYFYIVDKLEHIADDPERLQKMDNAIWMTGDYTDVTMDDCDWFFDQVEELWCEYHDVQSSGFFDPPDPLPVVPKGLLSIPDKI